MMLARALLASAALVSAHAQTPDDISRIRDEGLNHSQVMETLSHLTETIGPRLTGSPNLKRANEWTRDQLVTWGLTNAQLEPWGPFGRGWASKRFSAQIVEPSAFPLIAYPKAWSPGLKQPVTAEVIYLNARTEEELEPYRGKLKGTIVLTSPVREVNARFEPLSSRLSEPELLQLANVSDPRYTAPYEGGRNRGGGTNNSPSAIGARRGGGGFGRGAFAGRLLGFAMEQGAVLAASSSTEGDGGAVFVTSAALPGGGSRGSNAPFAGPRVWSTDAPATLPQFAIASEDYNRLLRIIQPGGKLKMSVEMDAQFYDDDLMAYNTLAEIPGTDLKREIVMLGGHLDSWHAGTGATDNGAGVAAAIEAVRIIKALKLQPRRTIRIGLWTGEEQGLMGSRAYVSNHFGYFPGSGARAGVRSGGAGGDDSARADSGNSSRGEGGNPEGRRNLVRKREYDSLSVYFNLDHGAGRIRGIYLEGNEAARPVFSKWLQPLADLGANTITLSRSGGTDQVPFDTIGLPGFPFIQDPLDYWTRTHHSSADVLDRVPSADLKQAATVLAVCTYSAAMADKKMPRKPLE